MPRQPRVPKTPRKELTPNERAEIIGAYRVGTKLAEIATILGHNIKTVYNTIRVAPERENNVSKARGRHRKTTAETDELLAKTAIVAPTIPLRELNQNIVPTLSKRTTRRRLVEKKIRKHRQRKKPHLLAIHWQKRLAWALEHEH